MKLGVIANPFSRRGRGQRAIDTFREKMSQADMDVTIETTSGPGDGATLARSLSPLMDVIGVIGGDGTVHEVVNGLMPKPKPLVVLAAGTGNDFATLIEGPKNIDELLTVIRGGYAAMLDVMDLGDRYSVNSVGLGFEGLVNRESQKIGWIPGAALYLTAVLKTLAALECAHFSIVTASGDTLEGEKLLVSIGNGNRTGGAFYLTPDAIADDGLIDICVVEAMGRARVIGLLPTSIRGSHVGRKEVRMLRSEAVTITSHPQLPMHVDGELIDPAPETLEIKLHHRVLPVLCHNKRTPRLQHAPVKVL